MADEAGAAPSALKDDVTEINGPSPFVRRWRRPLMIAGPVLVLLVVGYVILFGGQYVSTDNAYIRADRVAISPSVSARVVAVGVHENQVVKKGDTLVELDPSDYAAAEKQAEAAYAEARLSVASLRAAYLQRVADLKNARQSVEYADREAVRQRDLKTAGVSSQADVDKAAHEAAQAHQQLTASQQGVVAALAELGGALHAPVDANPGVRQAHAKLDVAKKNFADTHVVAPEDGVVTKVDQVQVGAVVNAAQPLFWLVSGKPWIEANFKEDQLKNMRIGQAATVQIDAFGGRKFKARLASFSPGTGSSFSLLPPENATGNWVKVSQRVPVQFELIDPPSDMPMIAGLSAKIEVDTRSLPKHTEPAAAK